MKINILFAFLLTAFTFSTATSQSYGPIEWDIIGLGYAIPTGVGASGGFSFYTEPRYNINDKFSIGLRFEGALLGGAEDNDNFDVGISSTTSLTPDYYFMNNENKRGFAGLGIGLATGASFTVTNPDGTETEGDVGFTLGLTPRVGIELGLIRLAVSYNLALDDAVTNYLGINLGFNVGGRYKGS